MFESAEARILCFGAGGHASVIVDLLQRLGQFSALSILGAIAADEPRTTPSVPVLGGDADLERIVEKTGATHFIVGIGTIRGGDALRPRLYALGLQAGLVPFTAVHPSAVVAQSARIGPGSVIMAGAIIQAHCMIGANVIINTGATLDHDCRVGDHAHLAPGAICSGGVLIGETTHVGTGAVVIENRTIGAGATVGAGSVLVSDCGAGELWYGVPARPRSPRLRDQSG